MMDNQPELKAIDSMEVEWSEFINAEHMLESMNEVYLKTGYTLQIEYGIGGIERVYPVKFNR